MPYSNATYVYLYSKGWKPNSPSDAKIVKWKKKGNRLTAAYSIIAQDTNIALSKGSDVFRSTTFRAGAINFKDGNNKVETSDEIEFTSGYSYLGKGIDRLISYRSFAISNGSVPGIGLDTGGGNDVVSVEYNGQPSNHLGNDVGFEITGSLSTGNGDDQVSSKVMGYAEFASSLVGIRLLGTSQIDLGPGNDRITGHSNYRFGISVSEGSIVSAGDGDDVFDAITGGLWLAGGVDLGAGNDAAHIDLRNSQYTGNILNTGRFDGGDGIDTLHLPEGFYRVRTNSTYPNSFSILHQDVSAPFYVNRFEMIANAQGGTAATLREGDVYVIDGGVFQRNEDGDFLPF
jgi:hypothetical protein